MNKLSWSLVVEAILDFFIRFGAGLVVGWNIGKEDRRLLKEENRDLKLKTGMLENENEFIKERHSMDSDEYIRKHVLRKPE